MNKWFPVFVAATALLLFSPAAFAADNVMTHVGQGAGIAIGVAALGGCIGQGMAAKGVYESISRNPQAAGKLNAPFYVGMAFIESLVLFAFVIAFTLAGKT